VKIKGDDSIIKALDQALSPFNQQLAACQHLQELEKLRLDIFGKQGIIPGFFQKMKTLDQQEDKVQLAKALNVYKQQLTEAHQAMHAALEQAAIDASIATDAIDITLPGRGIPVGGAHPISAVKAKVIDIFSHMGFEEVDGPEIEHADINFTALNMAEDHPARAMHDTFYFNKDWLLRTHTSNVQIHSMKSRPPPLKVITAGRVYRSDSDPTHSPMFHQLEGFMVDKTCHFTDLKALLTNFMEAFFERAIEMRFRPSYFPFTEPSAEVDIKGSDGWLEVLGCGMIHPNVLEEVGIDPDEYSGYAFGCGLDRLAMLYYDVSDLRHFFTNDMAFLRQFDERE